MFVVDASVWVARFVPVDVHHEPSRTWIRDQAEQGRAMVAPSLLLPELAGAVARRTGKEDLAVQVVRLIQRVPRIRFVPLDARQAHRSTTLAAEFRLRGADAVYAALAEGLGIPLVTWDREQLDRLGAEVTVFRPHETGFRPAPE